MNSRNGVDNLLLFGSVNSLRCSFLVALVAGLSFIGIVSAQEVVDIDPRQLSQEAYDSLDPRLAEPATDSEIDAVLNFFEYQAEGDQLRALQWLEEEGISMARLQILLEESALIIATSEEWADGEPIDREQLDAYYNARGVPDDEQAASIELILSRAPELMPLLIEQED